MIEVSVIKTTSETFHVWCLRVSSRELSREDLIFSTTPRDLSNIPIYTYSHTDRSTPARSADSHKSPFRTPRRTNLSRTFRTPSRTRSTSVPNKKLFVFVLLKGQFLRVLREGKKNKISQISNFRCDDDALLQSSSSSSLIDDRFDSIPFHFLFVVVYVVVVRWSFPSLLKRRQRKQ